MDGSLCVKKKYSCTVKDHTKLLNRKKKPQNKLKLLTPQKDTICQIL